MEPIKVDYYECSELAAHILDLDYDEVETSEIERILFEKFNLDMETFQELIGHLVPLIDVGKSFLTENRYKGFSRLEKDSKSKVWLVKTLI